MADYSTLLRDHTTLKVRSIDRIFLQAYVPKLQTVGQVCIFLRWHRDVHIPSSAAFGKIGERFIKEIERFSEQHGIPMSGASLHSPECVALRQQAGQAVAAQFDPHLRGARIGHLEHARQAENLRTLRRQHRHDRREHSWPSSRGASLGRFRRAGPGQLW